jgi:hypothetical protein
MRAWERRILPLLFLVGCGSAAERVPDDRDGGTGGSIGVGGSGTTPSGSDEVLLISEVRSNGAHASSVDDTFADDFIELYNPGDAPIVVDDSWSVWHRSAQGSCQGDEIRYRGTGVTIPPRQHLLIVGLSYAGPAADAPFIGVFPGDSIADAASLWIDHAGKVIDALCYYYDDVTLGRLTGDCPTPYICKGTPVLNAPHDGTKGPSSSVDASLERKPGGAAGNGQDTGDSAADFQGIMPAAPQNLASPATP